MALNLIALVIAAMFFGAAGYVLFAEQPARLAIDDQAQLAEWKLSYRRGFLMQGSLALFGAVLGIIGWWISGSWWSLVGALLLLANWPYTLIVIKPVNDRLMGMPPEKASAASRRLIERWGHLHAGRMMLGALSTAGFFNALLWCLRTCS